MEGDYPTCDTWSPSCNMRNGSSYLIYPGFDSCHNPMPLPSLRMEVFRDGMEDYEYLYILKERLEKIKYLRNSSHEALVSEVKEFLKFPPSFLTAANNYTQKPSDFYRMRENAARLIIKLGEILERESQ